jgi:hypothetical protein
MIYGRFNWYMQKIELKNFIVYRQFDDIEIEYFFIFTENDLKSAKNFPYINL